MAKPMSRQRDLRLDFFKGFALITIFVNHVPGTVFENFTSRNFGFSDAAEAFVLMAGIAAAFAYTSSVKLSMAEAIRKTASRSFKLYWVHLLITALAITGVIMLANSLEVRDFLDRNNFRPLLLEPVTGIVGIVTLGHQLGYFNILPLYAVLILASPFLVNAALRSPYVLLAVSAGLWLAAGLLQVNFPNYPTSGGWFLNPLAWQLVFIIGIVIGVSTKEKRSFCSFHPLAYAIAVGYLAFSLIVVRWQLWPYIQAPSLPTVLFGFNKSYLTLPRLLHVLALAYAVIHLPVFSKVANSKLAAPVRHLGQNSLVAFATGSVVCILLQVIKAKYQLTIAHDAVLLAVGLSIQFLAIYISQRIRQTPAFAVHSSKHA